MVPRKEWIEMHRITVFDRIRWFWGDNGSWIMLGVIIGTLPFIPTYIAYIASYISPVLERIIERF